VSGEPEDDEHSPGQERPSKSARKRAAHAAQDLGEELIRLSDAELEALALPEQLIDAVRLARRISSRGGGARQRQFIGKLMRTIDRSRSGPHSAPAAPRTRAPPSASSASRPGANG
jgi:ribosome-associated protein